MPFFNRKWHFSMIEDNYKQRGLRNKLVKKLRLKGITDEAVLAALAKVPRHVFFEDALLVHAYEDKAFPIGEGQTISQPYTVAFQSEKLLIKPGDRILEVGTGSGYQAAILMEMGAKVYTIEFNRKLYELAKDFLPSLGYKPFFFFSLTSLASLFSLFSFSLISRGSLFSFFSLCSLLSLFSFLSPWAKAVPVRKTLMISSAKMLFTVLMIEFGLCQIEEFTWKF